MLNKTSEGPQQNSKNSTRYYFSEITRQWLKRSALRQKRSTMLKYETLIENHISPELGDIWIDQIDEQIIYAFVEKKRLKGRIDGNGGLAPSYISTMLFIINSTIRYAAQMKLCGSLQPINVKSTIKSDEIKILSSKERCILEAFLEHDLSNISLGIHLSLNTGLRIGEVCALQWSDMDMKNKILHVRHTVARVKNHDPEIPNKTMVN